MTAHLGRRIRHLPQRAELHRFHQLFKQIPIINGHLLQLLQALLGGAGVADVESY